ncbi:MAG: hypothetical protein WC939_04115 [Acholeplasmataceae bacterium]
MKRLGFLVIAIIFAFTLVGCWAGEITVDTTFNLDGSGTRSYILYVMDESLSDEDITNPDDPDGTENKGKVHNNTYIEGGVVAMQAWFEANAPKILTVEPMKTEGIYRIFTLTMKFKNFDEFVAQYKELVNLSPTITWDDFEDDDKPQFKSSGFLTKEATFTESRAILEASMDWAADGIYNDLWKPEDLDGFGVTKADIHVFANYKLKVGNTVFEDLQRFDPDAVDGEGTGKVVYPQAPKFQTKGKAMNMPMVILLVVGGVVVLGGAAAGVYFVLKKKKA